MFRGEGLAKLAAALAENYRTYTSPEAFVPSKYESLQSKLVRASCVIAINVELHPGKVPEWEEVAAVACAVQNMWLTATALQVGAYWSTPAHLDALGRFLGLTAAQKCLGLCYMGYHQAKARPAVRGPIAEKLTWWKPEDNDGERRLTGNNSLIPGRTCGRVRGSLTSRYHSTKIRHVGAFGRPTPKKAQNGSPRSVPRTP
ncbi:MAG: nitroreductase family protein [Cytophagales bacterium]|nr:nitroreductase family protein [Cytophagales bacterium]